MSGLLIIVGQLAIAQCIPDPQYTQPGFYPDTATGLPCAVNGVLYDEDITLVVLADTQVFPPPAPAVIVDSAVLVSMTGLPPGIGYACGNTLNNSTNSWAGGTSGCINITGISTTNGTYQILAIVESYGAGVTTPASTENVDYYSITIADSNNGTDVITACDSYTWIDSNTYTSNNNTATHTLTNIGGCDSVVTLDLTINTVDNGITNSSPTLTATAAGAAYQWLDCDNNFAQITGETNQSFTATTSGNYAVEVTQNNCTDTSDCQTVTIIGLQENKTNAIHIYPNPTTGLLTIKGVEGIASIYDIYGRLMLTTNTNTLDISQAAMGIYFVRVLDEQGNVYSQKVVKD